MSARGRVAGRRRNSRAAIAIDVLVGAPQLSATTLAKALAMSIRSATDLLDDFMRDGLVVEVTHRAKRRLFALRGLTPLRDETAPPATTRPAPGPAAERSARRGTRSIGHAGATAFFGGTPGDRPKRRRSLDGACRRCHPLDQTEPRSIGAAFELRLSGAIACARALAFRTDPVTGGTWIPPNGGPVDRKTLTD